MQGPAKGFRMKILFDIVHPADVLFFRHPIRMLQERGDTVLVASRRKDVTCELLDSLDIPHRPLSRAGRGLHRLAAELVQRESRLLRLCLAEKPDVMVGFGGVAISHVGKLLRIPAISFYDTEIASLQTRITWPFITRLYVPDCYTGPVPTGRTTRFPGWKELSYFHPDRFTPNFEAAKRAGFEPSRRNIFLRFVSWDANHDIGRSGWTRETMEKLAAALGLRGKLHISAEGALPATLDRFRFRGDVREAHHLLAHCALYVGESATMAAEAAVLGVPAIYAAAQGRGYIDDMAKSGMVIHIPRPEAAEISAAAGTFLDRPAEETKSLHAALLEGKPDLAAYIVEAIDRHASA
jgi:predicted glycosyltransferase